MQVSRKNFLKEKKIIIVTHKSLTGFAQYLEEFIVPKKIKRFLIIEHPLHPEVGRSQSTYRYYENGVLAKSKSSNVSFAIQLLNYIKASLITVLWIIKLRGKWDLYIGTNNLNAFAGLVLKRFGVVDKVVFYSVDFIPKRFDNKLLNYFYHFVDKICVIHSDEVWILSPRMLEGRKQYSKIDKKYDKKQFHVPEGVWVKRIKRKKIGDIWKHTAVFVGTLLERMGVQIIIQAIPLIRKKIPDFKLIVIVKGPYEDYLKELAKRIGVSEHFIFKGFIESHEDVENLIASCAIGFATYTKDLSGLTYYADPAKTKIYLGAGIPVIMTDSFYNAHDIENAGAGIVVKGEKEEIAKAVIDILSHEENLEKYRERALAFAREFDHEILFEKNLWRILSKK